MAVCVTRQIVQTIGFRDQVHLSNVLQHIERVRKKNSPLGPAQILRTLIEDSLNRAAERPEGTPLLCIRHASVWWAHSGW